MPPDFEARLRTGAPLVADGGMGALLQAAVPGLRGPEEANLRSPESVVSLHLGFIRAGADVIETNSFGANRHKLRAQFLEPDVAAINEASVKLAREAREVSGRDVFIAGSIGPIGDVGNREPDRAALFQEQAALLEGRGVDLIMLETFYDLGELVAAIDAVGAVVSLPIVALMSFDSDGETLGGVHAAEAAERVRGLGLAAFGANHGAGLRAALRALESMSAADRARRAAERRPRLDRRRPHRLPPRHPRLLRRLRRTRHGARRAPDRRLLRHDPGRDCRHPRGRRPASATEHRDRAAPAGATHHHGRGHSRNEAATNARDG